MTSIIDCHSYLFTYVTYIIEIDLSGVLSYTGLAFKSIQCLVGCNIDIFMYIVYIWQV